MIKTKICTSCEEAKPATSEFFNKRKQSKDGFEYKCKPCSRNREDRKSAKSKRIETEKLRGFRTCKKCSLEKPLDEYNRTDGSTRAICKHCHNENMREQRKSNKTEDIEYHSIRESLNGARKRAKINGYDFNITIEDLVPFPTHCEVSGIELTYGLGDKRSGASLDKVIPSKGYTKGNVRIISSRVNMAKSDLTLSQLKKLVMYIEKYK